MILQKLLKEKCDVARFQASYAVLELVLRSVSIELFDSTSGPENSDLAHVPSTSI